MKRFTPNTSYFRVATATPKVHIGDANKNKDEITRLYKAAVVGKASLVVFPELCITGYSLGDTVRQQSLLKNALATLIELAQQTSAQHTAMIVGLPFVHDDRLYNCAALLADGHIKGIVTKSNLPNYSEFYEQRWYQPFIGSSTTRIRNRDIPFGQNLLFDIDGVPIGIEICEDLWVPNQPSRLLSEAGTLIIANPSASPELVGKASYRKELVRMTSAVQRCAYVYAGADWTESTTDIVMSGHAIVCENGSVIAERQPFSDDTSLMYADVDIDHLRHDRAQSTTSSMAGIPAVRIPTNIRRQQTTLERTYPKSYFLPEYESELERTKRLERIFDIQAHGLARRLQAIGSTNMVLGLSGGLDSTLALLVAHKAAILLEKKPFECITTLTMPGPASSQRTQDNAQALAKALKIPNIVLPITSSVTNELDILQHAGEQDVTYENVQARTRTQLLFNYANLHHAIVIGTGDLSEIALGWCTFGGDHLSHYNVNASIAKTLVADLVLYASETSACAPAASILADILATPISPELTTNNTSAISQKTEDIIGPYIVHDFFLYHVIRFGDAPEKIAYVASQTFKDVYSTQQIYTWLQQFYKRFSTNQFKRSVMPDGPKVGSIALSPRGDWRMPSDMSDALWQ